MRIVFGDLEADNLLAKATKVHCGVFKDKRTKEVFKFRPDQVPQLLAFLDTADVLVMHNGIGYDLPLLEKLYGYVFKGKKVDTLIMSRLLDPKRLVPFNCPNKKAGPHSIESWGWRVGRGKPEHNDWENFSEAMLHRCSEDVEILELVYDRLIEEAKGGDWKQAFLLSFKLFENLQKQEQYGWLVDRPYMEKCIHQLDRWINLIDKALTPHLPLRVDVEEAKKGGEYSYVSKPFKKDGSYSKATYEWILGIGLNPDVSPVCGPYSRISFRRTDLNSNAETKEYLLNEGWEPLEWNINDDGERTSPKMSKDDPFEGINGKVGKLVARRVQCRQRKSIIEGLIGLIRADGRIASIVNTLAVTGRATHRNIVNIPKAGSFYGKQMRKIFVADTAKGKVLVGTDSDSNQIRQLAARMGGEAFIEAVVNGSKENGTDHHSLTMKAGDLDSRDTAKTTMYCLLFGGGDTKLGKSAKKPGQGTELRKKLYRGLDGLEELMERLTKEWKATAKQRYNEKFRRMEYYNGKITGLDGRPIVVPSEHMLLVYLLQSDEAIHMAAAYNIFHSDMEKMGYVYGVHYGTVCWYHDEFTVECDAEIAEIVKKTAELAIAKAGKFYKIKCPHIGDGKIGKDWFAIH